MHMVYDGFLLGPVDVVFRWAGNLEFLRKSMVNQCLKKKNMEDLWYRIMERLEAEVYE